MTISIDRELQKKLLDSAEIELPTSSGNQEEETTNEEEDYVKEEDDDTEDLQ